MSNPDATSENQPLGTGYPRIVTNGKYYRIEVKPGKFSMDCGGEGASWVWESRFLWRARMHLRLVQHDEAEATSRLPQKWLPVSTAGSSQGNSVPPLGKSVSPALPAAQEEGKDHSA